jgi:hypothetical protein
VRGSPVSKDVNTEVEKSTTFADGLEKMWEAQRLTTLRASTAYYRDSFIFTVDGTFVSE